MKKLWMLCVANLKKAKANTFSLLIMFVISALLFNAGLLVLLNFGTFFDKTVQELNTSDTYYLIANQLYDEKVEDYIFHHENVTEYQKEESLWTIAITDVLGDPTELFFLINNADIKRDMSKWRCEGECLPLTDTSIYLPVSFHLRNGYEMGDEFSIMFQNITKRYTVNGFVEDIFFNSQDAGIPGLYVSSQGYTDLADVLGEEAKVTKLFINLNEMNKELEIGIKKMTNAQTLSASTEFSNSMLSLDINVMKLARVTMTSMIAVIFVAFSTIITIVCLLVVRFRIGNTIEDDMTMIGSLKAIGYTSRQIILSIGLQFVLIASLGSILGIGASYLAIPSLSDVFAVQTAFVWQQGFDAGISIFTLLFILFVVVLVSLITARRIHKLNPIIALHGGIVSHNFRRNYFPLSKSKGKLPFLLAMKFNFNNLKQCLMILIISITIGFAGAFSVGMFYNTNVDIKVFKETPGMEMSNVSAVIHSNVDRVDFAEKVSLLDRVRKVQYIDYTSTYIQGIEVATFIMKDYSQRETITVYDGRYPIHENEIAINGYFAQIIDKQIGDSIVVNYGEINAEYLITGYSQGAQFAGMSAFITQDGIKKIYPTFQPLNLQIYLDEGANTQQFMEELDELYGNELQGAFDVNETMEVGSKPYVDLVSQAGIAIFIITILVIVLVLYFVINSSVVRSKKQLGIQKAFGFTTFQLMNQLSLGFIFPVTMGVFLGCWMGIYASNPILSIVQRSMGIMKANFIITPVWVYLLGVGIIVVAYVTALLTTYKIRKISAYSLISE